MDEQLLEPPTPPMPLSSRTWKELSQAVYEINSASNHADFASSVVAAMCRLIDADVAIFQALDRKNRRLMTHMSPPNPFTPEEINYYTANSGEFPLVAYYEQENDPCARRLSDIVDIAEWIQSKYYQTCLARQGLKYCLALPITVDVDTIAALSFDRKETDFTRRDCELLDAFAPHFRQAWARHEAPWAGEYEMTARKYFQGLGLAPRESEVLYWMTEGKLNREISTILGISLGTVQDYVANILAKLKQENRHSATVFAIGKLRKMR
jgi:DNA-binding CsgD family transcriptional regulator